jgi:hypothetical protein
MGGQHGELRVLAEQGGEDCDAAGRESRGLLEAERSDTGRLCVFRIVDRYSGSVPEQKPRDVSFLRDVLPDGSSFVACGFTKRGGREPYTSDWVIWNVTVLCGSQLGDEDWTVQRTKVAEMLQSQRRWRGPGVMDNCLIVVPNGEEARALAEDALEAELREATKGAQESVWTGSFAKLRNSLSEESEQATCGVRHV